MKILTAQQIRKADQFTIENEPVPSILLMERASMAFCEKFTQLYPDRTIPVHVICGKGNNGGDGLAIARLLHVQDRKVRVSIVEHRDNGSCDFSINLKKLPAKIPICTVHTAEDLITNEGEILVDAILGSGLNSPLRGLLQKLVQALNTLNNPKTAVDIPTGLFADASTSGTALECMHTIAFELPKLSFFFPENEKHLGRWHIVPIGLSHPFINKQDTCFRFLNKKKASALLKKRETFSHKGTFGHALLIAGSQNMTGACLLAAKACLRSGTGLLTCCTSGHSQPVMQSAVPEAMTLGDPEKEHISRIPPLAGFQAIGIGCGIGKSQATRQALHKVLKTAGMPLVIDADALNIISEQPEWLSLVPPKSILTPHPKEFERLTGSWKGDEERINKQRQLAQEHQLTVLVKGAFSSIALPNGNVYFNSTGNPGMATGGSGDVLAGILTGLLAQGYEPENACLLGVYLHGLSGDLAKKEKGEEGLIAGDLTDYLPKAFQALKKQSPLC